MKALLKNSLSAAATAAAVLCAMDITAYSLVVDGTLGLVPAAAAACF